MTCLRARVCHPCSYLGVSLPPPPTTHASSLPPPSSRSFCSLCLTCVPVSAAFSALSCPARTPGTAFLKHLNILSCRLLHSVSVCIFSVMCPCAKCPFEVTKMTLSASRSRATCRGSDSARFKVRVKPGLHRTLPAQCPLPPVPPTGTSHCSLPERRSSSGMAVCPDVHLTCRGRAGAVPAQH